MRVLHLAAECAPVAKVGGLGDVIGALPKFAAASGVEAAVVMPRYGSRTERPLQPDGPAPTVFAGALSLDGRSRPFEVRRSDALGFPLFLVDEPEHFGAPGVYVDARTNAPFPNGDDRWLAFSLAALTWLRDADTGDGHARFDILHAHDHHAALVPVLARTADAYAALRHTPAVFTVHSAEHQGVYPRETWARLGAPAPPQGNLNAMRAAVRWADRVTTVSPTYARELIADAAVAHGLLPAFAAAEGKLSGILNGIDPAVWSPRHDPFLPAPYSADDLTGKATAKRAVCAALGLDPARPLLAFVGRLMEEKGAEILPDGLRRILGRHDASVAVLGSGKAHFEADMQATADEAPGRLALRLGFDEGLAHRLYAAADVFLMPSKVEPCGLGQLYALTYGTPPVAHATGGLRDTIRDAARPDSNGFLFHEHTADAFAEAAARALALHADADAWRALQRRAMRDDWSWARSAAAYAALYEGLKGLEG